MACAPDEYHLHPLAFIVALFIVWLSSTRPDGGRCGIAVWLLCIFQQGGDAVNVGRASHFLLSPPIVISLNNRISMLTLYRVCSCSHLFTPVPYTALL